MLDILVENFDALSKEAKESIAKVASTILDKPREELTEAEIITVLNMEALTQPTKIKVTIEETRPTAVQYANNRYGAEIDVDLAEVKQFLIERMATNENPVTGFLEANGLLRSLITSKYSRLEQVLRECIRNAQAKDGISALPGGRFNK